MGGVLIEQDQPAIRFQHDIEPANDAHQAQRNLQQRRWMGWKLPGWRTGLPEEAKIGAGDCFWLDGVSETGADWPIWKILGTRRRSGQGLDAG